MSERLTFRKKDLSGSEFRSVSLSEAIFDGVDLSGARFFNVCLRDAQIGAVDFGGSRFSCMNTGEDHPRKAAEFQNIELDNCTLKNCHFRGTRLVECDLTGMTIDGVLVTELLEAYEATR
jgi:uncharacterized protein YjbI with pentapeptide repeats